MPAHRALIGLVAVALAAGEAAAQQAQVVQLPTFSFFTVSTTVSVPDSGGAFSGGERRFSSGHTAFGPAWGRQRGFGRDAGGGGLRVAGQIHDFEAMDKALLSKGSPGQVEPDDPFARRLAQASASSAGQAPVDSLAEARRQRAAEEEALVQKTLAIVEDARRAEAKGKPGMALAYYKMAARRASGQLKADILKEVRRLSRPAEQ
jgi:hypothetical protein